MNSHWLAIVALTALAVAGCRARPEQRAVMDTYQEELRRYEGIIYDLEYQNNVLCTENERLKKRLEGGASRPRRADEGPRLLDGIPKAGGTTKPDDLPSLDIEIGDPTTSPKPNSTKPAPNKKPVMPEAEPDHGPSPEIKPPANRTKPAEDLDSPPGNVDLSPPASKPKPEEVIESHPTDIDMPPMIKSEVKTPSLDDEEPPPKVPSILKAPEKPKPSESLPTPRPKVFPNAKPKQPELLPAPSARRTTFLDAAGSHGQAPPARPTFALPDQPPLPQQQQWTPRTARRSAGEDLR